MIKKKKLRNLFYCRPYFSIMSSIIFIVLINSGCVSPDPSQESVEPLQSIPVEETSPPYSSESSPKEIPSDLPEAQIIDQSTIEIEVEQEDLDSELDEESTREPEPEEYIPTEDLFISTFNRVEEIIRELNGIIQSRDFERWVQFLTSDHRAQLSSPDYLQEVSRRPVLANRSIVLTSLQDYFLQVVVPSRANLRLDDLIFINEQKVQAFMMFGETKISLYQLVYVDGDWKIGEF